MNKSNRFGFTLVELLAVIVILAIILVIAVPKVMSVIEDAKKATLESTAKMIASGAEKARVQNTVLGKEEVITCKSVAKINDIDYKGCTVEFDNNSKAVVTIIGSGKFEGFNVCKGTKSLSTAVKESCSLVTLTVNVDGGNANKIYEENYESGVTVELEVPTKEGYTFKEWIVTGNNASILNGKLIIGTTDTTVKAEWEINTYIINYELDGGTLGSNAPTNGKYGDTVTLVNPTKEGYVFKSWTSSNSENLNGNNLTIGLENITLVAIWEPLATGYIMDLLKNESTLNNGLINPKGTYDGKEYDTGIRYSGSMEEVNNKVYYNCDDKDSSNISYGEDNYSYEDSCEVWRIIGVFDVDNGKGNVEKRVKLVNTASTFQASWDSSVSTINDGFGVNQWGESTLEDGTTAYAGADLMQLLNGYYIGKTGSECKYNNTSGQSGFGQTCTTESLTAANMKPLTTKSKEMINNAVWYTYGVKYNGTAITLSNVNTVYLQENGISNQYSGKDCVGTTENNGKYCNDNVERTTSWIGLVGLMYTSDFGYSNGWLYDEGLYPRTLTPVSYYSSAYYVWYSFLSSAVKLNPSSSQGVWPSVYLSSNVKIIGGDGKDTPYKLAI